MPAEIGRPAPGFTLRDQHNREVSLGDFRGSKLLVVFIPFPFTTVCEGELLAIRDDYNTIADVGAKVVAITCDTQHANRVWSEQKGLQFPILSDFWPHGAVARDYGCFDESTGAALRYSFILDAEAIVRRLCGRTS
jgi:mycoredoxin-dependent peroxiredoxin